MRALELITGLWCSVCVLAAPFLPYGHTPSKRQAPCDNPAIRPEWRNMADEHKFAYVEAEQCLFGRSATSGLPGATNRIEDLAAVHQVLSAYIHNNGVFLPWHRFMLYAHETLLRNECGYMGPMPWWDETLDAGQFQQAPMFTDDFFGSAPPLPAQCITDGEFYDTMLTVGPGLSETEHCLNRGVDDNLSADVTNDYVDRCNSFSDYNEMYSCVFGGPHAIGHDAIGGVMSDVDSSPGDPIFYLHHAMIDRNWLNWQEADLDNRLYAVSGPIVEGCQDNCAQTALDTPLTLYGIVPDIFVQDIMDTQGGLLCYAYDY